MKALRWMDRYRKEVLQVSTWKHGINVQYLYDRIGLGEKIIFFLFFHRIWITLKELTSLFQSLTSWTSIQPLRTDPRLVRANLSSNCFTNYCNPIWGALFQNSNQNEKFYEKSPNKCSRDKAVHTNVFQTVNPL